MISNRLMRDLIEEVIATPGFSVVVDGQRVKVTGPLGSTNLRAGNSHGHDDKDWRKALKRYCGWPPTPVQAALNEAQTKAEARWATSSRSGAALALPGLPTTAVAPAVKPAKATPAVAAVIATPQPVASTAPDALPPSVRWTQAVYRHLKEHSSIDRRWQVYAIGEAIERHDVSPGSWSSLMSSRWLEAKEGDPFLHIWRRREGHSNVYWWDRRLRDHERPDMMREPCLGQEPEPRPVVPEPEPVPPLVVPVAPEPVVVPEPVEPKRWQTPEEVHDAIERGRVMVGLPDVFERVGAIDGDLLLRDENGDVWRARKGVL